MELFSKEKKTKKGFRPLDIILFTFSAVFVIDSLGLSLTIGWSSILWWLFLGIIFFLPYGLITSELTTTYPNGGIYNWVVRGLGKKNGARSNFFYWINVAFWMPSVYLVLGSTFVYSIDATIVEQSWFVWVNMAIAIAATWITWAINKIDLDRVKWLPNLGSIIKLGLVGMMIIAMIVFLAKGNPIQTDINGEQGGILPDFSAPFGVVGIIVYNMCGFELSTNLGDDVKDVKKTIPKSLMIGGITVIAAYIIASIPAFITINTNNPAFQDGGYVNSIILVFQSAFPTPLVIILAGLLAFTLLTNMLSWTLGSNRAIAEAADNNEIPKSFSKMNKHGCPTFASTILTLVSTIAILLSSVLEFVNAGDAYFILFSFSLIIFFLPYIMIFISYLKLRVIDKDIERPFSIKNNTLAKIAGYTALVIIIVACVTQVLEISFINGTIVIFPVSDFGEGSIAWASLIATIGGVIACVIAGDIMIWWARKNSPGSSSKFETTSRKGQNSDLFNNDNDQFIKIKIKSIKEYFYTNKQNIITKIQMRNLRNNFHLNKKGFYHVKTS